VHAHDIPPLPLLPRDGPDAHDRVAPGAMHLVFVRLVQLLTPHLCPQRERCVCPLSASIPSPQRTNRRL
jgi:hypothetical protein